MGSDENFPGVIRLQTFKQELQIIGGLLRLLNRNIVGAPPYPCAVHKRGVLTEKNAAGNKNPAIPVHRPVTRKFAAQLAGKGQQQSIEEVRPSAQPVLSTNETRDCIIIDADDYKNADDHDHDVPMFVQHTEAMLEEIDKMDAEIEMEDIDADEPVLDIDSCDKKNPLAVTEYIDEIYAYYKKTEILSCVPPNYMAQQFDINERMRGILIDWLIEEKLMVNTLQFNLSLPTPYVFMRRFLKAAQSDKRVELLSYFIIELCLVEYEMLRFPPSLLAAAAIFTAQCTISGCKQWSKTCERHTNYTQDELTECAKIMVSFHQKAGSGKLTGVHKKYSTSKYGYAAKEQPAVFLVML
ncbi:UNVERIFIED_CONTAM: Cyclin-B2-4 [Sesamum angustifolium]|uniref:Cyclin-B2-4 n=1 Tax=Sesamum angustifolium TaxID=2727405 RepID=A0AAW2L5N3_9LAMI